MRTLVRALTGAPLQYGLQVVSGECGHLEGRWLIAISPILLASPKEERFTIAHELAEFALRDRIDVEDVENVCDAIARAIILPDIAILEVEAAGLTEREIADRYELPRRHVATRLAEHAEYREQAQREKSGRWLTGPSAVTTASRVG